MNESSTSASECLQMSSRKRISRNDPCPCGSGKKYKRCCGHANIIQPEASSDAIVPPTAPAEQMYEQAMTLRNTGQSEAAKRLYEEILQYWPNETRAMSGLGSCLVQLGQRDRGLELARKAAESDPPGLIALMELALMLFNLGEIEESLKWAKQATTLGPEGANAYMIIANCYERTHRIKEGLEANRLAQNANPQNTWLKLQEARLVARGGAFEKAVNVLQETLRTPALPAELKSQAFSEMGRALDKLHLYDQAYEAFVQSGLAASQTPNAQRFNPELRPAIIDAYNKSLTEERINRWGPDDLKDGSWIPTFLVGFPRSGTTMTEHILAAHSGVLTLSEQPYLDHLRLEWARMVGAKPDMGLMIDQLDAGKILQLRKIYREKVEADQEIPAGTTAIIDKVPLNIIDIGFINLVFPEAKVIIALRDPRDCSLSCFMQDFELNSAMIHFLALDRTVRFYTQVMGAWLHLRNIITLPHITVRYEDTVQNLEKQAKRLIEFLDLDWEPGILQFHQRAAEQVISTPSYVAVTEPVHTRAVERWKHYQEPFVPLLPMLEPFIREFGYELES